MPSRRAWAEMPQPGNVGVDVGNKVDGPGVGPIDGLYRTSSIPFHVTAPIKYTVTAKKKPLVYTYFKDEPISPSKASQIRSLLDFKDKLHELRHFYKLYKNIDDLKFLFDQQLNKFIPKLIDTISYSR